MFGLGINKLGTPRGQALTEPETLLFANDEEGTFLDFTQSQVYADTAGTDPAEVGEGIALTLDKSQGGELGPELVTNGTFDTDTDWTKGTGWTISGGVATFNNPTGTLLSQSGYSFLAGKAYAITFTVSGAPNSPAVDVRLSGGGGSVASASYGNGTRTVIVFADINRTTLNFLGYALGSPFNLDNVSVRELKGVHALQATSTARPIFGRVPVGGRRNLDVNTNVFIGPLRATLTAGAATSPSGDTDATSFIEDTTNNTHIFNKILGNPLSAGTYTRSYFFKMLGRRYAQILLIVDAASANDKHSAMFDLQDGVITSTFSDAGISGGDQTIESVGDGWYRCSITLSLATNLRLDVQVALSNTTTASGVSPAYLGDGTSGILIYGQQLEAGPTPTPYQKVVTQHDITEAGVPSVAKAFFDRSDDILPITLPTITGGTVALVGLNGIWIEDDWDFTAGTLSIGPTTIAGLPAGILSVVGDLCAVIINDRAWTAAERAGVISWGKARGAPGVFSLGEELVTNGTFDADTDWLKGTGWTIAAGVATKTAGVGSNLSQDISLSSGAVYTVSYTVSGLTAGSIQPKFTGGTNVNGILRTTNGTYTEILVAVSGNTTFALTANAGFDGSIDNIFVSKLELLP